MCDIYWLSPLCTQRVVAHPDVSYRIAAMDEDMGIVLFRLDFGNTNSYGPGNALALFETFMDIMAKNTSSGWPTCEAKKPKQSSGPVNK
jgi:hypothetical protein